MIRVLRDSFRHQFFGRNFVNQLGSSYPCHETVTNYAPANLAYLRSNDLVKNFSLLTQTHFKTDTQIPSDTFLPSRCSQFSFFSSNPINNSPRSSVRTKTRKNSKSVSKPPLNVAQFEQSVSQLPPRFTPEDLCKTLALEEDPQVCFELFKWASQQPRFKHDISTYHTTIKKLGCAKLYEEMDDVVNQVIAVPNTGSEALYNTIIYFSTEARKLSRAVTIYKHMRRSKDPGCWPSVRTYNLLFAAFLSRGNNSYINHMYMENIRCLFKQMVDDVIEPDIFSLNSMIKGYVLSLHVNDALRIFHQMGVVYTCLPNSHSYDYLIHGLCAQGRTNNAKELYREMKNKGFVPSSKAYNSLVNSLAMGGEVEEAVSFLWEMSEKWRSADLITYRTVLGEICRQGRVGDAMSLLKEWQEKDFVDGHIYRKLLYGLEDDFGSSNDRNGFR
ncbi:hypothetical protein HHK36_016567 [Tetracentron sinense]|uniref:Pentatricopeptide repeat-containing protein n=1 Tax=Tetracentron sinense TaxID=13715 RepID=A0A834Z0K0_TETSI|nr:hypothetical protein HHK36_016567 [Tetracentron sinense]